MKNEYLELIYESDRSAHKLETLIEEIENEHGELFQEKSFKKMQVSNAAKELLRSQKARDTFFSIFAKESVDYLVTVLEKRIKDPVKKKKGAYLLYLIFRFLGKDGGFFRLSIGTQAKELLKHKDEDIRSGAELAKSHIERQMDDMGSSKDDEL
jgi:hypothetical protein